MADYNINAVTRKVVYTGSAGLGPYSFSFEVLVNTDIAVYFNTTLLTLTTDYSVTINANGTGSVTIVTGTGVPTTPDGDDTITIVGARDIERTTDFSVGGDLSAAALNEQLDAEIIFIQQIDERVDRAIKAAVTDPTTINMELPVIATRANKLLAFDADGDVTVSTETVSQIEGAATSATAAAASAVAAAASETAAGVSETNAAASAVTAAANNGGVFVSANDTTAGNLEAKVLASGLIGLSTQNDGANETFTVDVPIASQAQAEAGTDTATAMTPQRVSQAIAALATSGATDAEKSNIMLNSFRIEEQSGLTVQGMVDGVSDVFTDESGVDTVTSTDETYNAAGDYYHNPGVLAVTPNTGDYTGNTGNYTIGAGSASCLSGSHNIYVTTALSGDFSISINLAAGGTSSKFGVFLASEVGTFNATANAGGMDSMTSSWWFDTGAGQYKYGTSSVQGLAQTTGTYILARVGSVITLTAPATSKVFTQESSADVIICLCSQGSSTYNTMSWTSAGTPANTVLVSDTFTALSQPDTTFVAIWHEDVDACTPNTDFTVEASRDAGTTWTAGTLALATTLGAAEILTCSIDISAQPAGTSMRWRVKFLNTLSQRLHGVGLQWS
jgi:hypothetical protein